MAVAASRGEAALGGAGERRQRILGRAAQREAARRLSNRPRNGASGRLAAAAPRLLLGLRRGFSLAEGVDADLSAVEELDRVGDDVVALGSDSGRRNPPTALSRLRVSRGQAM